MNLLSHPQLQEVVLNNLAVPNVLGLRSANSATNAVVLQFAQGKLADATRDVPNDAMEARRRIRSIPRPSCPFSFVRLLQRTLSEDQWSDFVSEVQVIDTRLFSKMEGKERELIKALIANPIHLQFLSTKLNRIGQLGPLIAQCREMRFLATPEMFFNSFSEDARALEPYWKDRPELKENVLPPPPPPSGFATAASVLSKLPNIELFHCETRGCSFSEVMTTAAEYWPNLTALRVNFLEKTDDMSIISDVLRRLEILEVETFSRLPIGQILLNCDRFQVLHLGLCEPRGLSDAELREILAANEHLEELGVVWKEKVSDSFLLPMSRLRRLRSVKIALSPQWDISTWQAALSALAPQLVELRIGDSDYRGCTLTYDFLAPLATSNRTLPLEVLEIHWSSCNGGVTGQTVAAILAKCPRLRALHIPNTTSGRLPGTQCAIAAATHCRELQAWDCVSLVLTDADVAFIAKHCVQLELLHTKTAISDATLVALLKNARNMRSLHAKGSQLTVDGIKALGLLGSRKIKYCNLVAVRGDKEEVPTGDVSTPSMNDIGSDSTPGDVLQFLRRTQPQMGITPPSAGWLVSS